MAARNFAPVRAYDREVILLLGGGTGAGAANLTSVVGRGVSTIVRTGVGLHTITLSDKFNKLLWFSFEVMDPTAPDDWDVRALAEDVDGAKTITIAIFKAGVAAELTSDEKLKFALYLSNTAQAPTAR